MPTVYNKVTAGGSTLIDLSQDTVTSASDIVSGKVGHLADGTQVTGTGTGGGSWDIAAGTITPSADTKTLSLSVDFEPQYVFVITDLYDLAQTSAWKNTFFISNRVDGYSACIITRYINSAFGMNHGGFSTADKATYSDGVLTLTGYDFKWLSGVTYKWFCVGAKT